MDNSNDGGSSQPTKDHIHESYGEFEDNVDVEIENESTKQSSAKSKNFTSKAWTYFYM